MRLEFIFIFIGFSLSFECSSTIIPRSKRNTKNGCENLEQIQGLDAIKYPRRFHGEFARPWLRTDINVKLFASKALTYNWMWMKELKVRGLNATVNELLDVLEKQGCLFIPYGEGVKDLLLGSIKDTSPLKIEGESTCDITKVYQICEKAFGWFRCGGKPTQTHHRVTFGKLDDNERFTKAMVDPIIISSWNSTFNRPQIQWEFTANAVGLYDNTAGKVFLIDFTGNSVKDICQHIIGLPVDPGNWYKWTQNNLVKIMRYYNLEADGFITKGGVRNLIMRNVQKLYNPLKFQEYYCRYVYDGIFVLTDGDHLLLDSIENSTSSSQIIIPECRVVNPDPRSGRIIGLINKTLERDYDKFWREQMLEDLRLINFVNLDEDPVFLDGAATQASYPRFGRFDYDDTTTTFISPTAEEYPGDDKYQEEYSVNENSDKSEKSNDPSSSNKCVITSFIIASVLIIIATPFF